VGLPSLEANSGSHADQRVATWTPDAELHVDDLLAVFTRHSCCSLLLLLLVMLSLPDPRTEAKEAVIFEQICQLARVTA